MQKFSFVRKSPKILKTLLLCGAFMFAIGQFALAARPVQSVQKTAKQKSDIQELQDSHRQFQQAIEELNQLNPFSQDYRPEAAPTPAGGTSGPAEQLRALLSNPAVRSYLRFFQSSAFAEGAQAIAQSGNRKTLIWVEVIWFLLMFLSRSRSLSQVSTSSWGRVLWINLSHLIILWAGALIAIPWILFGEPYRKVIWGFFSVLFS